MGRTAAGWLAANALMERGQVRHCGEASLVILATVNDGTSVAFITLGVLIGLMLLILYLFLK